MSLLRKLHSLLQHGSFDDELNEEVQFHVGMKTSDHIATGMNPREAREAALQDFGRVEKTKEECRDMRGTQWIEEIWQDLRYGVRILAKDRKFTAWRVDGEGNLRLVSRAAFNTLDCFCLPTASPQLTATPIQIPCTTSQRLSLSLLLEGNVHINRVVIVR
jgi:hypothetical protein